MQAGSPHPLWRENQNPTCRLKPVANLFIKGGHRFSLEFTPIAMQGGSGKWQKRENNPYCMRAFISLTALPIPERTPLAIIAWPIFNSTISFIPQTSFTFL